MRPWMLVWILCTTTVILMPVCLHGAISVHFKTGRPLYVALGQTLVLEAAFEKNQEDVIDMVTWDRKRGNDNIRLSPGSRISLEKGDSLLRITDVAEGDFGIYKVTVTDSNGYQQFDSVEVRKIEEPPKASIVPVLECVVEKHDMAQWDSPQFSWLIDGVAVTNQTVLLAGGSRLKVSQVKGVNYTCVIKSSLGTRLTTHYEVEPKESSNPCCRGLIVGAVIVALCVAGFIFLKRCKKRHLAKGVGHD